jgi:hypothetical protein
MHTFIPGQDADSIVSKEVLPAVYEHYESDPDEDRVYLVDAPGGALGQDLVTRFAIEIDEDTEFVCAPTDRTGVRILMAHDKTAATRRWIESSNLKILVLISQIIGTVVDHATASRRGGLQALRPSRQP